jgi:superfamily II DNA or RNA helicase
MSQESPTPSAGTLVDVRGGRWRVVEVIDHGACRSCRLVGTSASNVGVHRTLVAPFDRLLPTERAARLRSVGRRRWMLGLRALLADDCPADGLRGAAHASIDLLDYQLEPALACARGATRLLLADEVGLGKTIQAGVILADLCAHADSIHALVLCPAGLCLQWQRELRDRFGLAAELADLPCLRRQARASLTGAGPWDRMSIAVASVDFVKQPEVLTGMGEVRWDLLVIDEAHLCAVAPERSAAVNALARRARRVVLMTATPHPGEAGAFDALCRIGRLAGEGLLLMFRRTRADLGRATTRRGYVLRVGLSAAERLMHTLLERYTSRVWAAASASPPRSDARLAMIVLRKRAASGAWPLLVSLSRRRRWLGRPEAAEAAQLSLPLGAGETTESEDDESWQILAAPGLADSGAERRILERLIELTRAAVACDSKCRVLVRFLRRAREPAVVFTEYRDTLIHLAGILSRVARVAVVHGGMDAASRADSVDAFTNGSVDLLLATDAAAHGLNLQSRCRLVIDLELPWNPVRLEQRVGRVDRIGQRQIVHAVHLVARQTGEEQLLNRLALRIRRSREALGGTESPISGLSEIEVAERVFARCDTARELTSVGDGVVASLVGGPMRVAPGGGSRRQDPPDWPTEVNSGVSLRTGSGGAAPLGLLHPGSRTESVEPAVARLDLSMASHEEVTRLERVRQLRRHREDAVMDALVALERSATWCTRLRVRGALPFRRALVAIFRADLVDRRGGLVERHLTAVQCPWPPPLILSQERAAPFEMAETLLSALRAEAERDAYKRLETLRAVWPSRLAPLAARESALAQADNAPLTAYQPGLFDRRMLRLVAREQQARTLRLEETGAQLEALSSRQHLSLAGPPCAMLLALAECTDFGSGRISISATR